MIKTAGKAAHPRNCLQTEINRIFIYEYTHLSTDIFYKNWIDICCIMALGATLIHLLSTSKQEKTHHRRMRKRQWYTISSFLFLLVATIIYNIFIKTYQSHPDRYAKRLEAVLHQEEAKFEKIFTDDQLINQIVQHYDPDSKSVLPPDPDQIAGLTRQLFSLLIYKKGQLIYWSNNDAIPVNGQLEEILDNPDLRFAKINDGYFEILQASKIGKLGEYKLLGLIPVRKQYSVKSNFLKDQFLYITNFPNNIQLSETLDGSVVRNKEGFPLFSISSEGPIRTPQQQSILFILILLTVIALLVLINELANHFSKRFSPGAGAFFLLLAAGGMRFAAYKTPISGIFDSISVLNQIMEIQVLNGSLGDLMINSLLVFWLAIFFHREFEIKPIVHLSTGLKLGITAANFSIIIFSILFLIRIFRSLVLESALVLDFDNILNFNLYSLLALVCILFLIISLFLFSHKIMMATRNLGQSPINKIVALGLAILITYPFIWSFDLRWPFSWIIVISIGYLVIFDLFLENNYSGYTWLVIWVSAFSGFGSALLFKYNLDKDLENRVRFAEKLAEPGDKKTAGKLFILKEQLAQNDSLKQWLTNVGDEKTDIKDIRFLVDSLFQVENELYNQFTYEILAVNKRNRESPIEGQDPEDARLILDDDSPFSATEFEGVFSYLRTPGSYAYNIQVPFSAADQPRNETIFCTVFHPRQRKPSKVYSELLLSSELEADTNYADYNYEIIYFNNSINTGGGSDELLADIAGKLDKGEWENNTTAKSADLIYKADNGNIVRVSKEIGGITKPISLFSYLFVLIIFLILILNGLNYFFKAFPQTLGLELFGKPSLRNRIQTAVVLLTIGSFFLIALVTATFFRNSSIEYHENRLQRKITTVVEDLQHQINFASQLGVQDINYKALATNASDIHRMDINIFGLDGELIASSAQNVFDIGILSKRMDANAFFTLRNYSGTKVQDENLGSLHYISAYLPIHNTDNRAVGYLNLPYYSQDSDLRKDVYDFMGTMLNVYVFLFMLAGIIAIVVARSITKPIAEIGEKLNYVRLGENDPLELEWKSQDELGDLINQYNKMIYKLDESTEKLKVSEREVAWREMAKQIAHEIKNPLTPMKLSIQYLNHAYKSNPNNVEPLLNRVSKTLIEQIDGLSRIASEFSNFAKMPKAENQAFSINQLLRSIHNLYYENQSETLSIHLSLPKKDYSVFGDRGHLMRVFNNLVKNAIQAIPEERIGRIDISLRLKDENVLVAKVSDNGVGISANMQANVFFPNFTTKNSGMGLGLAISKNIIDSINGKIYFKTKEGSGTDFYVELPVFDSEEALI